MRIDAPEWPKVKWEHPYDPDKKSRFWIAETVYNGLVYRCGYDTKRQVLERLGAHLDQRIHEEAFTELWLSSQR